MDLPLANEFRIMELSFPHSASLMDLPLGIELWIVGVTLALLLWTFRGVSARQAEAVRSAEAAASRACYREIEADHDLYLSALVELAYDPGWPGEPRERVEEMKHFALYTLRAATMTKIPKRERETDAIR
jgi:hypothetical protein